MDNPHLSMLQYSAAITSPIRLEVRTHEGETNEVSLDSPFALIGRSSQCDITLSEPTVSFRHAYLQPIGNRLALIDLLSLTGIKWSGPKFKGWLSSEMEFRIGTNKLRLLDENWDVDETLKDPLSFRPRDVHRPEYGALPLVELELLNTSAKGKAWPINRIVTLVGRDDGCRITVVDDRLSKVQCGLLLLPAGLWAIDLLGKGGIKLNGESVRCGLISEGSILQIGPYKLTAHYTFNPISPAPALPQEPVEGVSDFLTRLNKVFKAEIFNDTVVVMPMGDSQSFLYKDIHVEASRIIELITNRNMRHVIIDFSHVETIGQLMLEALASFCRNSPGKAALCAANYETYASIEKSVLNKHWPHYLTRNDALQAVYLP